MDAKYKALKEDFVSNLSGGSLAEMNLVTLVAPVCPSETIAAQEKHEADMEEKKTSALLWSILQSRHSAFTPYTVDAFLVDFLLNCCAILFVTTIYSSYPLALNLFLLVPAVVVYFSPPSKRPPRHAAKAQTENGAAVKKNEAKERPEQDLPVKPFITTYRGCMMVVTCAAILAVDFRVFPRRFAKVENWGTSLMDMGVGSFVFSAGVVSARAILREQVRGQRVALLRRLRDSVRHALPLLLLGAVRTYSVKGLDYAEHVTEYGVHWNFFYTLALLPPFVALFHFLFRFVPSYAFLSLIVAVAYQMALDSTELTAFILTAPRTGLFSQNREGIFSFVGYLAIFLAGHSTGMYVLPRQPAQASNASLPSRLRTSILARLTLWSLIWSALLLAATSRVAGGLQVSRRLANLPYVLWVSAFNTAQLALFCGIEALCFPDLYQPRAPTTDVERQRCKEATSRMLSAFNRNGLLVFLLANLLTGLVNLTVRTIEVADLAAVGVLVGYMAALSAVALGLDWAG